MTNSTVNIHSNTGFVYEHVNVGTDVATGVCKDICIIYGFILPKVTKIVNDREDSNLGISTFRVPGLARIPSNELDCNVENASRCRILRLKICRILDSYRKIWKRLCKCFIGVVKLYFLSLIFFFFLPLVIVYTIFSGI